MSTPLLFVGLGNPGAPYAFTRHNAGAILIDALAASYRLRVSTKREGAVGEGTIDGLRVYTFKPSSYMNLSGPPVAQFARFYKIPLQNVWVCHDDIDLRLGQIKIKQGGGNGGHNGLKSLDSHLGKDYWRLRLGVGRPATEAAVSQFVLDEFPPSEWAILEPRYQMMVQHLPLLLKGEHQNFLNHIYQT